MSLTIRIPTQLRALTGGAGEVDVEAATVGVRSRPSTPPTPAWPTDCSTSPGVATLRERLPGDEDVRFWTVWPRQFRQARLFPSFRPSPGVNPPRPRQGLNWPYTAALARASRRVSISTRQMRVLMVLNGQQSDGGTHQMAKLIAFQEEARRGPRNRHEQAGGRRACHLGPKGRMWCSTRSGRPDNTNTESPSPRRSNLEDPLRRLAPSSSRKWRRRLTTSPVRTTTPPCCMGHGS